MYSIKDVHPIALRGPSRGLERLKKPQFSSLMTKFRVGYRNVACMTKLNGIEKHREDHPAAVIVRIREIWTLTAMKLTNEIKIVKIQNISLRTLGVTLRTKADTNIRKVFVHNLQPLIDAYDDMMKMGDLNSKNEEKLRLNYGKLRTMSLQLQKRNLSKNVQIKKPKRNEFILQNLQISKFKNRKTKGKHSTYIPPQNQNKSFELDLLMTRGNPYETTKIYRNWDVIFAPRTHKWDHSLITAHLDIYAKLIKRKLLQPNTKENSIF